MKSIKIQKDSPFSLENGTLPRLEICYAISGTPNPDGSNVVLVCAPFTASPIVSDWWTRLFGNDRFFNPNKHCVICTAILGSAYGTTGPLSETPSGNLFYYDFPEITVRDIARVNLVVLKSLGLKSTGIIIGPSLGGMVALEMAIISPDCVNNLVLIGSNTQQSQYLAAYSESQRMILELDATWGSRNADAGQDGLRIARSVAVLSYRPYSAYAITQFGKDPITGKHRSASYQHYKGNELAKRFNAISYHRLLGAFDSHNIGRNRGGIDQALSWVTVRTLVVSMSGDQIFPEHEQKELAEGIERGEWARIDTAFGHDGFLIESEQLTKVLAAFLGRESDWINCNAN